MAEVTVHQAKSNLSKLLRQVEQGEEVIVCRGKERVARILPFKPVLPGRPKVGEFLALGVSWSDDCFSPLQSLEVESWIR